MKVLMQTRRWLRLFFVNVILFSVFGCGAAAPVATTIANTATAYMYKILVRVGGKIIATSVGHTLQVALDCLFFTSKEKEGVIIINSMDPKRGIYKGTMKVKHENGNEAILQDPPVVRNSESESSWTLDPKVKSEVIKKLK